MRASVVINTCDRLPHLRRLLPALERQRGADFEAVVVNGPSADGTAEYLRGWGARIKVVDCPERNLSLSRNLGIAAAAGDIVLFIDDDALPEDGRWVARALAAFAGDPDGRLGAVTGEVRRADTDAYEFRGVWTDDYGFQLFRADAPPGGRWLPRVCGGNAAFRRTVLAELGGFDPFYRYYHDESDLSLRLGRAGYRVETVPGFAVRHYPARAAGGRSPYVRDWSVIAASDAYFAVKNGGDPQPLRLVRALRAAARKHYVAELAGARRAGLLGTAAWCRMTLRCARGTARGTLAGLFRPRTPARFPAPPAFRPFGPPAAEAPPLRIALLTRTVPGQPGYGGIGRYTFDLARGLHERGHEVHVLCRSEQPLRRESLGFLVHGIAERDLGPAIGGNAPVLAKNLRYAMAVARKLAALRAAGTAIDVVHATNWDAEAAAVLRTRAAPTVLMLVTPLAQTIAAEGWEKTEDLARCVALDRWQVLHAGAVCAPSGGVLESYREHMGLVPGGDYAPRIVPLGVAFDPAGPLPPRGRRRTLLYVGRFERRKGIDDLLEALPDLLPRFPDWDVELVGRDPENAAGETRAAAFRKRHGRRGWARRVRFRGEVHDAALREAYRRCDLFVAPSRFESFGLIYHEAMQYGKAVVGCRTGGVPETVEHGVDGWLVEPGSVHDLRAALGRLMADDPFRARLGAAGARRVRERQNHLTMAAALEPVYRAAAEVAK